MEVSNEHVQPHGSVRIYVIGFALSILLTFVAFLAVDKQLLSGASLVVAIMVLAIVQLWVQLQFFLHLGQESRPKWNLISFLFAVLVVLIVVAGTLWIMANLDYHDMTPEQTDQYLIEEEGIRR